MNLDLNQVIMFFYCVKNTLFYTKTQSGYIY